MNIFCTETFLFKKESSYISFILNDIRLTKKSLVSEFLNENDSWINKFTEELRPLEKKNIPSSQDFISLAVSRFRSEQRLVAEFAMN